MNIFKSIRDFFAAKPYDKSTYRLYLRRGTMSEMKLAKPFYVGEIVLCLDEPCFGVGVDGGFDLIRFDPSSPAGNAIRHHYTEADWIKTTPTW